MLLLRCVFSLRLNSPKFRPAGVFEVECATLWVRCRKASVAETVVSVERHRFRHCQIAADVVHSRRQAACHPPSTEELAQTSRYLCIKQPSLKLICWRTGIQCSSHRTGMMWSRRLALDTSRAAAFWTDCTMRTRLPAVPDISELQ